MLLEDKLAKLAKVEDTSEFYYLRLGHDPNRNPVFLIRAYMISGRLCLATYPAYGSLFERCCSALYMIQPFMHLEFCRNAYAPMRTLHSAGVPNIGIVARECYPIQVLDDETTAYLVAISNVAACLSNLRLFVR